MLNFRSLPQYPSAYSIPLFEIMSDFPVPETRVLAVASHVGDQLQLRELD